MEKENIDLQALEEGHYCQKQSPGCFCKVDWPREMLCVDCGPNRDPSDMKSFCVCPPKD